MLEEFVEQLAISSLLVSDPSHVHHRLQEEAVGPEDEVRRGKTFPCRARRARPRWGRHAGSYTNPGSVLPFRGQEPIDARDGPPKAHQDTELRAHTQIRGGRGDT